MAYSESFRKQVLNELKEGVSASKLSLKYHVSIPTIRNWKEKFLKTEEYNELVQPKEEKVVRLLGENRQVVETSENDIALSIPKYVSQIGRKCKEGKLEEALEMCNHQKYKNSEEVTFHRAITYEKLGTRDSNAQYYIEAYLIILDLSFWVNEIYDKQRFIIEKKYLNLT